MDTIIKNIRNIIALFAALFSVTIVSATDVGTPSGAFTLSSTGGAVYSVEIEAPKGINGMQPSLAITYNSQSGHGIAGLGFNVSGLSMITRGMNSLYYDDVVTGIKFNNSDAFYLDGKRLLFQSGASGVDGAKYTPEGDPFTEVTLHTNTIMSSPGLWFEVKSNDGITYQYGYSPNQSMLIEKNGSYFQNAWYIGRAEDQLGNYMTFNYVSYGNTVYPNQIAYGKNTNGNGSFNYINFVYEDEPYTIPSYHVNGCTVRMPKRLKTINTTNGSSVYRTFEFNYSYVSLGNSNFSALSSVTEKNGIGSSLSPITFTWQSASGYSQTVTQPSVPLKESTTWESFSNRSFFSTDLNGDGFSDIIQISPVRLSLGYGSYTTETYLYINSTSYNKTTNTLSYQSPSSYSLGSIFDFDGWSRKACNPIVLDYNGDGVNDLIIPNINVVEENGLKYADFRIILGNKSGFYNSSYYRILLYSGESPLFASADIDNDGMSEVIALERNKYGSSYPMTIISHSENEPTSDELFLPSDPQEIFLADFNNNGLNDLMVVHSGGYKIYWNQTGTLWGAPFISLMCTEGTTVSHNASVDIGDFNGDGSPDFLLGSTESTDWYIAYGNGDGTFNKQLAGSFNIYDQSTGDDDDCMRCLVYDFNGDGKSDVMIEKNRYSGSDYSGTVVMWLQSTGTALSLVKTATSVRQEDGEPSHFLLGDFTGSGRTELMNYGFDCYNGNNANVTASLRLYQQQGYSAKSGKLVSATDGLGNSTSIDYSSLVNSGSYTPQYDAVLPVADVAMPINVVTKTVQTNGAAGSNTKLYEYGGTKVHLRGKGFLGFSMTKTIDQATQDSVRTTISNWDPQAYFVPKNSSTTVFRGGQIETTSNTLSVVAKGTRNYFTYPSSQISTDMYGNTTTMTRQCNNTYGYVTSENVSYGSNMYKNTAYSNYTKKGLIWLPQTITSTQKHEDDNNIYTDNTSILYDSYGQKTQMTVHQGTDKAVTTTYSYSSTGNLLTEVSSGIGVPNITYYYTYASNERDLTQAYTSPATKSIYYSYDAWGNVLTEQDRTNSSNYLTTTFTYDGWNRVLSKTEPTGLVTNYSYGWGTSLAKKYYVYEKTQARSAIYKWYDACGREVLESSNGLKGIELSNTIAYDAKGRVSSRQESRGQASNTINYTYDSWDRLSTMSSSFDGTTNYTYGNRLVTSVKNGQTYTKTLDAWGNIKSSTDPVSSVTYVYLSNGKPGTVSSSGFTITMEYDAVGNQTLLNDPDAGQSTYQYNATGNLTSQTDARGNTTQMTYDNLGRISAITTGSNVINYYYGSSGNSILRLTKKQCGNNYVQYSYDSYGRLSSEQRSIDSNDLLVFSYSYNSYDQISQITYPGSLSIGYVYDDYGCRTGMTANGNSIWSVSSYNGQSLSSSLEGWYSVCNFDGLGRVVSKSRSGSSAAVSHPLAFMYSNTTGNVTARMGVTSNLVTEQFQYDGIDRLTGVTVPNSSAGMLSYLATTMNEDEKTVSQRFGNSSEMIADYLSKHSIRSGGSSTITYASNGNISSKTGIGSYTYSDSTHPHALTSVNNNSSLIPTATQNVTYNEYGKVGSISENGYSMSFIYGPDQKRWKTVLTQNGTTKRTTIYADDYEKITEDGVTRQFYYLDDDVIGVITNGGTITFYKGWTDNQGTYAQLADHNYNVVFNAEYDPWGKQDVLTNTIGFHRGYTGHEMLPEFGLINMNGRLYDPLLGRFLSPDNYVQLPDFSQNFNRYSYCLNNPLKYTDPSGELFGIDDAIVGVGLAMLISGTANVVANWNDINGVWHGLSMFGVGAASAGLSIAGYPFLGAMLMGSGNSILNQGFNNGWNNINTDAVLASTGMSLVTYGIGNQIGLKYDNIVTKVTKGIDNEVLRAGAHDALSGFLGGFSWGSGISLLSGENWGDALLEGFKYGSQGAIFNGLNGLNRGYMGSKKYGKESTKEQKPLQKHHYATNKNKKYTLEMQKIANKYGLDLDDSWNTDLLPHKGRHPNMYHDWILNQMRIIDQMPNMNKHDFLIQFEMRVKQPIRKNPDMLYKEFWITP